MENDRPEQQAINKLNTFKDQDEQQKRKDHNKFQEKPQLKYKQKEQTKEVDIKQAVTEQKQKVFSQFADKGSQNQEDRDRKQFDVVGTYNQPKPIQQESEMQQQTPSIQIPQTQHFSAQNEPQFQQLTFTQKERQRQYMECIDEIKAILNDYQLISIKFIHFILRHFSPFVFQENLKQTRMQEQKLEKQQQKKQNQPFDSDASFESNGQIKKKHKTQNPKDKNNLIIDQKFFDTEWLDGLNPKQIVKITNLFKYNAIFHCRIVFILHFLTSDQYSVQKSQNLKFTEGLQQLKKNLLKNRIKYSFDQQVFTQQTPQYYKYPTPKYNQHNKNESFQKKTFLQNQIFNDTLFKKIYHFYTKLGFKNANHPFNKKMTVLKNEMYRIRYIKEFAYYSFANVDEIFRFLKTQNSERFRNVQFYYNQIKITHGRFNIQNIHINKSTDYQWLQRSHDYIQWLFPNHYRSNFNSNSFPLGYVQAQIFKTDKKIRKLLLRSFNIYLDFMGCQMREVEKKSQQNIQYKMITIERILGKEPDIRLKECLIYNAHNHMRIMRILACLSVTGLRQYADSFLRFLNSLLKNYPRDFSRIQRALNKDWNVYSKNPQNQQEALEMCFIPYLSFPQLNFDQQEKEKESKAESSRKFSVNSEKYGHKKTKSCFGIGT